MKTKLFFLLALVFQICFAQVYNSSLLAYYSFDGNTNNALGSNYNLFQGGSGTSYTFNNNGGITGGQINNSGCYEFNSGMFLMTNDFAPLFDTDPSQSFSISYWVRNNVQQGNTLPTHFEFFTSAFTRGGLVWGASTASNQFTTSSAAAANNANQWYHIVYIFNRASNVQRIFVNGVLLFDLAANDNLFRYTPAFTVGGGFNVNLTINSQKSFNGRIDEMYVFNRAIDPSEVTALYNKQTPISLSFTDENLLAYYPFNGNAENAHSTSTAYNLTNDGGTFLTTGVSGGAINNSGCVRVQNGQLLWNNSFWNALNNNPNQNLSISYWIRYDSVPAGGGLNTQFEFFSSLFTRGNLAWGVNTSPTGTGQFSLGGGTFATTNNIWYHMVVVFDVAEQELKIYRNGVLIGSTAYIGNAIFRYNSRFVLGGGTNANGTFNNQKQINASFDEVYIFNKALNSLEISSLFNKNSPTTLSNQQVELPSISVFPVPFTNEINISLSKSISGQLKLYDFSGKELYQAKIHDSNININTLSNLPKGLYMLQIETNHGETFIHKLIK